MFLENSSHTSLPGVDEVNAETLSSSWDRGDQKSTSDSLRWRPLFHIAAPRGWLNDPCGLGYDPVTKVYHLSFQWNPHQNDWGNISWGHAISRDMVSWSVDREPCLIPSTEYDNCGIFTGCMLSCNLNGNADALTYIYTSVRRLPLHYTLPYVAGSESLSLAISHDHGSTWKRIDGNPILPGPPPGLQVTAWRDPFVSSWSAMGDQPGLPPSTLCGFISGGVANQTPSVFVYTINPSDLREWKFSGLLVNVGLNCRLSRWSGDLGVNWEVASWIPLTGCDGVLRNFTVMGAEGCLGSSGVDKEVSRAQLWMCVTPRPGPLQNEMTTPLTTYAFSGIFDHGCGYAANSFLDPVTQQNIVYCWITEEGLADARRYRQGWSGVISLPRVVKLMTLYRVKRARCSALDSITSIETESSSIKGTHTVRTLGIHPDPRLEKLRQPSKHTSIESFPLGNYSQTTSLRGDSIQLETMHWELQAEFTVTEKCTRVGIRINHNTSNPNASTTLTWEPSTETFIIQRPPSPADSGIQHPPLIVAPHTLFTSTNVPEDSLEGPLEDPLEEETEEETEEPLRIQIFFDKSVLEVFVNERTVISTRVYLFPPDTNIENDVCASNVQFFAEGEAESQHTPALSTPPAVLLHADLWDGLG